MKKALVLFMTNNPEESSKNIEPTVTSSVNQTAAKNETSDKINQQKHAKQEDNVVAVNPGITDPENQNKYFSLIPNFVKNLARGKSSSDEESDESSGSGTEEDSRPGSDAGEENTEQNGDEHQVAPAQPLPPLNNQPRPAMQFHPIFPQAVDMPPPLNQWHLYNKQTSFNPRCRDPNDPPIIQAVKKPKRRKSSGKHKTPKMKKKGHKEDKEDRPLKAPELKELPTTAAPRSNFNQAPKSSATACPNYNCPPCAQPNNLPPCPPTMTIPSCSQPMSACIPPASAIGGTVGSYPQNPNAGCAAAVSDPCNPCISGGYRQNNYNGQTCPDMYPQQADLCNPSNCHNPAPVNNCPVELCEKSVCYCEKCENPDPNVPPQYNMQQWTCKFLRPVDQASYYGNGGGNGRGGGYDPGFQMPQGGPGGHGGPGGGMGQMPAGMPMPCNGGVGASSTAMGFNPNCNPVCNPTYANQQNQMYQQQQPQGRACPPPGGYGNGCPPGGNPPQPPRCPVPCAPRCPPRCCYQKTFTDWADKDALMSRITVQPQRQHEMRTPTLRSVAFNPNSNMVSSYNPNTNMVSTFNPNTNMVSTFNPNTNMVSTFNPNTNMVPSYNPNTNTVSYHPELMQVTGAISAPQPRFDESYVQQSPRYATSVRTPQMNPYKRNRNMYVKEPTAMDMVEPDLLSTRASQLRYHYSQQRRSETPRVTTTTKKTEIYNGEIDWKSEPKLHSSETVASKLRRQHNRNKLKEINDG